jgi:hypothetical protein
MELSSIDLDDDSCGKVDQVAVEPTYARIDLHCEVASFQCPRHHPLRLGQGSRATGSELLAHCSHPVHALCRVTQFSDPTPRHVIVYGVVEELLEIGRRQAGRDIDERLLQGHHSHAASRGGVAENSAMNSDPGHRPRLAGRADSDVDQTRFVLDQSP